MNVFNHKRPLRRDNYDLAGALLEFLDRMKAQGQGEAAPCEPDRFALLLTGPAALRKVPGIPGAMGADTLFLCSRDGGDAAAVREHCRKLYSADDAAGLAAFAEKEYNTQNDYTQFRSFWKGRPCFDMSALDERGKFLFTACKDFAELLAPIAGRKGFLAFDCAERLGMWRAALAAGIITEEEFWQKVRPLASAASDRYDSFLEYAAGYLCGACYDMFRGQMAEEGKVDKEEMRRYVELNCRVLEQLLTGPWRAAAWYKRPPKQYKLSPGQLKPVLTGYEGGDKVACIASDRITVDGMPVGYLYREAPLDPNVPDSGWRIFAGDESPDYMADAAHFEFYHLNTICNYDDSILELLNAPAPAAFRRAGDGWQQEER